MNLETQTELEILYSKNQQIPVLREQFSEILTDLEDEDWVSFLTDMLAQIYLHRQADVETMVGVLHPKHGTPQEVADKLLLAAEFDYIDFDPDKAKFIVVYDISDDVVAMLDRYQYPLPMVIEPRTVSKNNETGYVTEKVSVILNGSEYFRDKDVCLDHLNRANSVPLALDMRTFVSAEGKFITPKRKTGEDFVEYRKRLKQATIFYETSVEVMEGLQSVSDKLWLTHRYDRRGRTYASGYHVNTQGTDWNKAVVQLANKELVK